MNFYPRSPCGERLHGCYSLRYPAQFLSTLSLRRATTWQRGSRVTYVISIHALLAESDKSIINSIMQRNDFYPRSPCGERPLPNTTRCRVIHFYPRSPCGERPRLASIFSDGAKISIHALLAESDNQLHVNGTTKTVIFLSTLSLRRATHKTGNNCIDYCISIHALLAESDGGCVAGNWPRVIFLSTLSLRRATALAPEENPTQKNFYPRSPCGERHA